MVAAAPTVLDCNALRLAHREAGDVRIRVVRETDAGHAVRARQLAVADDVRLVVARHLGAVDRAADLVALRGLAGINDAGPAGEHDPAARNLVRRFLVHRSLGSAHPRHDGDGGEREQRNTDATHGLSSHWKGFGTALEYGAFAAQGQRV